MQSHQDKAPVRQRQMQPASQGCTHEFTEERHRVNTHIDSAQSRHHKADHQRKIDQRLHNPERRILAPKQCRIPFPVQDLVQNHQHGHADACPLVPRFPCHLIGHQQQETDPQQGIYDVFGVFEAHFFPP